MNWNPSWANAIASIESQGSGGYSAVGPTTQKGNRAYGKYQVMDFNIPAWTKKHLGQKLTPEQFLQNPEAQDAVFKGEFGSYVSNYGNPQDAASAWFTGRPMSQGSKRSDILGTTGSGYVNKFNAALGTPNNTESKMIPEEKPRGLLGSLGIQKMEEGAEGEAGQRFFERDTFKDTAARLAQGFAAMGSSPALQKMTADVASQRTEVGAKNKTIEYLRANGRGDLADAVESGSLGIRDAAGIMFAQPKETAPYSPIAKLQADFAAGKVDQEGYNLALAKMKPSGMSIRTNSDGTFELTQGAGVSGGAFTEGQTKNISFAQRSSKALELFDPIADSLVSSFEALAEMDPTGMARYFQSDEFQKAQILGKDFLAPILRKDTGAAVTPSEWVFYKAIYIPEVGDNPAKLAEKKAARSRAVEAMKSGMSAAEILRVEGIDPDTAPKESEGSATNSPVKVDFSVMSYDELETYIEENEQK